jgi:peptidoglycan hydrolase-like protein with peptidoglycan-binding domain
MRKIIGAISLIAMIATVAPALAATTSTASTTFAQVQALLSQIQALQAQIQQLKTQQQQVVASLVSTLQQGSTGDQVKVLQAILASDPSVYPEGLVTGFFGRLTSQAVKKFQEKNGLPQVGVVGPQTLKKLNEFLEINPVGLESESENSSSTETGNQGKRPCAIVPPGHLIAPGWLKKEGGQAAPIVPLCQTLPPGILSKLGTTSTSTATSTVDTTAPTVSAVTTTSTTSTATIGWTTNEPATSQAFYGTTTAMGSSTPLDSGLVMGHSVTLFGLTASTTYFYEVQSKDASGNITTSAQGNLATQ